MPALTWLLVGVAQCQAFLAESGETGHDDCNLSTDLLMMLLRAPQMLKKSGINKGNAMNKLTFTARIFHVCAEEAMWRNRCETRACAHCGQLKEYPHRLRHRLPNLPTITYDPYLPKCLWYIELIPQTPLPTKMSSIYWADTTLFLFKLFLKISLFDVPGCSMFLVLTTAKIILVPCFCH